MIEVPKFQPLQRAPPTPEQQDAKLKNVGDLYERQFLREMVKAMRSTVSEGGLVKASQGEKIFKEQLDQEYVEKWGAKGGIGLADMIHNQLIEKYGTQLGIKPAAEKPRGPLKLSAKDNWTGFPKQTNPGAAASKKLDIEFMKMELASDKKDDAPTEITSPWAGKLLGKFKLGEDQNLLRIEHDNGLQSAIHYRGLASSLKVGEAVEAGQPLALLGPDETRFSLSIHPNVQKTQGF